MNSTRQCKTTEQHKKHVQSALESPKPKLSTRKKSNTQKSTSKSQSSQVKCTTQDSINEFIIQQFDS